jgi:hypothetical protein
MERTEVLSAEASSNTDRAKRRGLPGPLFGRSARRWRNLAPRFPGRRVSFDMKECHVERQFEGLR